MLTCVFAVASLTNSVRAISRLDRPAAMSRSTSASRGVRSSRAGAWSGGEVAAGGCGSADLGERVAALISRCRTDRPEEVVDDRLPAPLGRQAACHVIHLPPGN
jgi:hypothetical protein